MNAVVDRPEFTLGRHEAARLREMEQTFLRRPKLSIRLRIIAGFLLCFFLLAVTGLINLAILYRARAKAHFLDISQELSLDVQQARHLERLDYPSRKNLQEARESAKKASDLLVAEGVSILDISDEKELVGLNYKIGHYVQLLDDTPALLDTPSPDRSGETALAAELDGRSGEIMDLLRTMKAREAEGVNRVLRISQELPFVFAGVMLLIIFWIANLLVNTITASLTRLEESTRRIATGDFSLLQPARRYRDELSDLSVAVNRMLLELRARDAQVIKADRLASVGAFTAGIAHELEKTFGSIWTSVRMFMDGCRPTQDCPSYALLEGIFAETERGRETVQGLLEFTSDEVLGLGPVDLAAVVESARTLAQHQMSSAGVTFSNELPTTMPPVKAAFGQLKQVFLNLFHNALQAMPGGGVLSVRAGFLDQERVEITVADQGVGIPPENLAHVFDPFFTTREGSAGTGLGLSLAYSIMKQFGGEIRVESAVGKGTTVHLTLPLAE
jgi:two-component system NtrC family sensor kinase